MATEDTKAPTTTKAPAPKAKVKIPPLLVLQGMKLASLNAIVVALGGKPAEGKKQALEIIAKG